MGSESSWIGRDLIAYMCQKVRVASGMRRCLLCGMILMARAGAQDAARDQASQDDAPLLQLFKHDQGAGHHAPPSFASSPLPSAASTPSPTPSPACLTTKCQWPNMPRCVTEAVFNASEEIGHFCDFILAGRVYLMKCAVNFMAETLLKQKIQDTADLKRQGMVPA